MYSKLAGLQYKVVYKPGSTNLAADALSRHPTPPSQLQAVSSLQPAWVSEVLAGYDNDPSAAALLQKLALNPQAQPPYTLSRGLIRYKGRIWLSNTPTLQQKVISALHDSALGGHSGFPVTYSRVKKLFAWRGMKTAVQAYVAACTICLQAKPDRVIKYPGLLSPLSVPTESLQVVSMDFIEGLSTSGSTNCIMVVVDKFSKFAHFVPLLHPFTAQKVAQSFLDSIIRLHGLPTHIISDRDPNFTSAFWKELFCLAQVQLCVSSAYHP